MLHYLRLLPHIFMIEMRKFLAYRIDFWGNFFGGVVIEFVMAYYLWSSIFAATGKDNFGGYSFDQLMIYYFLVPAVAQMVHAHTMHFMSQDIYDGGLNRYLIYPLSFIFYKFVSHYTYSIVAFGQFVLVLTLILVFLGPGGFGAEIPWDRIGIGLLVTMCGAGTYFFIAGTLEMIAFWVEGVWSILVILKLSMRLLGANLMPLALYPDWGQEILRVLPFYYFTGFPVDIMLGRVSADQIYSGTAILLAWTVVLAICMRIVWNRGRLQYTGVGI